MFNQVANQVLSHHRSLHSVRQLNPVESQVDSRVLSLADNRQACLLVALAANQLCSRAANPARSQHVNHRRNPLHARLINRADSRAGSQAPSLLCSLFLVHLGNPVTSPAFSQVDDLPINQVVSQANSLRLILQYSRVHNRLHNRPCNLPGIQARSLVVIPLVSRL